MKKYIGTKMIEAEPVLCDMSGKLIPINTPVSLDELVERGYKVRYPDGYESFRPKDVFEKVYMPLTPNGEPEGEAPMICQSMVDDFILYHNTMTVGDRTTVVHAVLRNGFSITESSACVCAENYDMQIGEDICMEKIKDKVWMLLGFLLACGVNGIDGKVAWPKPTEG
nr:MAG TPA: hypothetical protein [Caudoviricetes sp.]